MIQVEICTPSVASAEAAKMGGAQRIELCRDLSCGGLTPLDEEIDFCVRKLGMRTHVLVRPRPGNFCYSEAEVEEIMATIGRCRRMGAAAVVVGFLDHDGHVDEALTRRSVEAAGTMEVTFHRAFDEASQDPVEALHVIAACGCTRLLTSGQAPTALEGAEVIRRLVQHAADCASPATGFKILAGSGIVPDNVRELVERTGVTEVHGSCKTTLPDGTVQTDAVQVRHLLEITNVL